MEGLSKMEKGLMNMDNNVVIVGGEGVRGLNGNGKNRIKIKCKKMGFFVLCIASLWHSL